MSGAVQSVKDVRSQWEESLSSADILRKKMVGSSDADVRTFWCKKLRICRNLWHTHGQRGEEGISQC